MKNSKLAFGLLVLFAMSGIALALQWSEEIKNSELHYSGGWSQAVYTTGSEVESYSLINHTTGFHVMVTQNGQDVAQLQSGPADVTVTLSTDALIGYTQSTSEKFPNNNPTVSASGVSIDPYFSDEAYNFFSDEYSNPDCTHTTGSLRLHILNEKVCESPMTYRPVQGLGCVKKNENCCWKYECDSKSTYSSPIDITITYKPAGELPNSQVSDPAYQSAPGMGKGYLYCKGNLYINGNDIGEITSNNQVFTTTTEIKSGMTELPVEARYQCYFVSELYTNANELQKIENIVYQMPNGGRAITPTVNVPIITPPTINLIPLIRIGTTDYTTDTTITLTQTQLTNLSFLVQRTDTLINILTTNLTWTYLGTPPEMPPALTTNPNWPLIPPLTGNNPPNPPQLLQPPTVVTICDVGKTRDTITLSINPDGTISETNTGDNTITLTIICQPEININLIPVITINTSTGTTTYLTDTTITLRRNERINLSLLVQRTDILNIPTTNLTWNYRMPPVNLLITDNTPFNPPLTGRTPINPPRLLQPPSEITVCEGDVISDTIVLTVNSDGSVSEIDVGDNTIIITINCQEDEMFFCRFRPHTQIIAPMEMGSTMMTCWNGTAEQIDCPTIDSDWIDYSDGFATYFETPIDWDQITYDSHDADNFNITAKERPLSEIAYSGEVTIDINPENDWEIWRNCDFDVRWGRQNCSYYM